MKNYGTVTIPKGTKGVFSESGMYDFWYPSIDKSTELPMDVIAKHLHLWEHQEPWLAFQVPMIVYKPTQLSENMQKYVCVWFRKEDIDGLLSQ
tara:strand:+ start:156 stop:434 length:279 start_codon:yes stop_codon:yes gene_type:complete